MSFFTHVDPGGSVHTLLFNWLGSQNSQNALKNARDILECVMSFSLCVSISVVIVCIR